MFVFIFTARMDDKNEFRLEGPKEVNNNNSNGYVREKWITFCFNARKSGFNKLAWFITKCQLHLHECNNSSPEWMFTYYPTGKLNWIFIRVFHMFGQFSTLRSTEVMSCFSSLMSNYNFFCTVNVDRQYFIMCSQELALLCFNYQLPN